MFTARKKIAKEAGAEPSELEEQVAQVRTRPAGQTVPASAAGGHAAAGKGGGREAAAGTGLVPGCRRYNISGAAAALWRLRADGAAAGAAREDRQGWRRRPAAAGGRPECRKQEMRQPELELLLLHQL